MKGNVSHAYINLRGTKNNKKVLVVEIASDKVYSTNEVGRPAHGFRVSTGIYAWNIYSNLGIFPSVFFFSWGGREVERRLLPSVFVFSAEC